MLRVSSLVAAELRHLYSQFSMSRVMPKSQPSLLLGDTATTGILFPF